ncbi:MAG: hypothetical protein MUP82_05695 [Candidatus Marinimicrobia bacterium]|nr:hypothetical protein [Candidatus Neomarinimicrobiota bacterium]
MWPALFTLFKTSVVIFIANDVFKRTYPAKHESAIINVSYSMIYLFSKCQIIFNRSCSKLAAFMNKHPHTKKILDYVCSKTAVRNQIYTINHLGETIATRTLDIGQSDTVQPDTVQSDTVQPDTVQPDTCIYIFADNEQMNKTGCVNKVILRTSPFVVKYEVSDIKFMLVEIKINDGFYKLNFKTDSYNYYVVNNRLDRQFFIYFLKKYQIYDFANDNIEEFASFHVKIIDQNVNVREFEITQSNFITIQKNDYTY